LGVIEIPLLFLHCPLATRGPLHRVELRRVARL
jgi:hypothetical protein